MITPRITRLLRTRTLRTCLDAISAAAADAAADAQPLLVLVPARAAARRLLQTLEEAALPAAARWAPPAVLTRTQMYERLADAASARDRWATAYDREVLLERGAHEAVTEGVGPPFNLRPALLGEMLELYDELRRHQQDVEHFERLLVSELEPHASSDRGAERVLRQTRFLAAAFRSYQSQIRDRDALDEHELRDRLLSGGVDAPWRRVLVTVGDRFVERGGLWPADFDLLARLGGIERLDVIATEAQLAAGFHERIHGLLPGLEEVSLEHRSSEPSTPVLEIPSPDALHFTTRDREEELIDVVRRVRSRAAHRRENADLDRTAIVFARPLPYLYLAREVFTSAGVPYQCDDALPLAAEPMAAAVDVVLTFAGSDAGREATLALLRSPHVGFAADGGPAWEDAVGALETGLGEAAYQGGVETLASLAAGWPDGPAARAARAAVEAAAALQPLLGSAPATTQLTALKEFLATRQPRDPTERDLRSRQAIRAILEGLTDAYGRGGGPAWDIGQLSAAIRRWTEAQTFEPRTGERGVNLIDGVSARYGRFDEVHLVGLVDGEWPERRRRNIFYSSFLLKRLGWTVESDPMTVHRAAFADLVRLAARRTSVSTLQLEQDALVEPSPLLEDLRESFLEREIAIASPAGGTVDEALLARSIPESLPTEAEAWARIRQSRSDRTSPAFRGEALPHTRAEYGVGSIELYAHCPFKYFARHVLGLREELDDEDALSARDRGVLVHEVLCAFFDRWQSSGRGAITAGLLDEAQALLQEVAEPLIARLPPSDAALERSRLSGSPVAPGIGALVLRMEAERATPVIARRLEERFSGTFELDAGEGTRAVAIRGIADRIDLLADGSLRVLDYKAAVPQAPLQLAIYAATAVQRLRAEQARAWTVGEAAYVVYGGRRGVKPLGRTPAELDRALSEAQQRFVDAVDAIQSGRFPPRPVHARLCATCDYALVCRKEYAGEPDDTNAATAV